MGCCGNNAGCKRASQETEELKFPAHDILDTLQNVSAEFMTKLQEIAFAGIRAGSIFRNLNIQNAALSQLAKQITDMAIENAYLKDVLNLFSPMDIGVGTSEIEIKFGPKHSYSLKVPVTDNNSRREIVKQLRLSADKLEAELKPQIPTVDSDQKLFPFVDPTAK